MTETKHKMPTTEDTPEYIEKYIQYKSDKMVILLNKMNKLNKHI